MSGNKGNDSIIDQETVDKVTEAVENTYESVSAAVADAKDSAIDYLAPKEPTPKEKVEGGIKEIAGGAKQAVAEGVAEVSDKAKALADRIDNGTH